MNMLSNVFGHESTTYDFMEMINLNVVNRAALPISSPQTQGADIVRLK